MQRQSKHSTKSPRRRRIGGDYTGMMGGHGHGHPKSAFKAHPSKENTASRNTRGMNVNMNHNTINVNTPTDKDLNTPSKDLTMVLDRLDSKLTEGGPSKSAKKVSTSSSSTAAACSSNTTGSSSGRNTAANSQSPLYSECISLLRAKQFRSCEIVSMYHLSNLRGDEGDLDIQILSEKAKTYEILGDCTSQQNQFNRAITFYKRALSHLKSLRPLVGVNNGGLASSNSIHSILQVQTSTEANIKLKEARCYAKIDNVAEAASILESAVPKTSTFRTFAMSMELGNFYLTSGRKSDAKSSFLDALARNMYAFEAIEKLVLLGAERSEVMRVVNESIKRKQVQQSEKENHGRGAGSGSTDGSNGGVSSTSLPVGDIVTAYFYSNRSTSSHQANALAQWKKLHAAYPHSMHVLLEMALLQSKNPSLESSAQAAESTFEKIRTLDYNFMEGMDTYASILAKQCNLAELGRLTGELLQVDDTRAEAWAALALYHDACGETDKALAFVDKAISCNANTKQNGSHTFTHTNAFCHKLKGSILLSQGRADIAGTCFFRANEIKRDISSYEGLVEICLSAKRYKEAICTAKEAMAFAPRDSRALTLVGLALSKATTSSTRDNGGKERAKKALRKALMLDPLSLRPLLALVDLYLADDDYDTCEELLKQGIEDGGQTSINATSPFMARAYDRQVILQTKLADLYSDSRKFTEALTHYHRALSLNPDCIEAKRGMERLEKAMKGCSHISGVDVSEMTEDVEHGYHDHHDLYDGGPLDL